MTSVISGPLRPTEVVVDLDAIRHNVALLKPRDAELLAVVKADGYGHGDVQVSRAALEAGATWLAVAMVEEGLSLRRAGIEAPILVLTEFPAGSEALAIEARLTPTVYTEAGVRRLAEATDTPIPVHLKLDTGMHRVGLYPPDQALAFARSIEEMGLVLDGVWTHFAKAGDDAAATQSQLDIFRAQLEALKSAGLAPRVVHAANTAATLAHPDSHFDLVRTGLGIYGIEPVRGVASGLTEPLKPAMSWVSRVSLGRQLPAGERISYGHRYGLEADSWVATIPVGYADGYPRGLSSRADVLIGGKRRPVAGTVTMDQIMADCGEDTVSTGDEVVLMGQQGDGVITATDLADILETIPYEIVTRIGPRVPRRYIG